MPTTATEIERSPFRKALDILLDGTQVSPEEFTARLESHVSTHYYEDPEGARQFLEKARSPQINHATFTEVCVALYGLED